VVEVAINVNLTATKGSLNKLKFKVPKAQKRALSLTAQWIQTAIKTRTAKGRDWKGGSFKSYSSGYKKKRLKKNRTLTPNLFYEGLMLGNMTNKQVSANKFKVFFPNQTQNRKAAYHDFFGAGKGKVIRPFFSVSNKEEMKAVNIFKKAFEKDLRI